MWLEELKRRVYAQMSQDKSGHGVDHVERVLHLSEKFAEHEDADLELVQVIALLHEVDDYKLFGQQSAEDLSHARRLLKWLAVSPERSELVLAELGRIGYSKRLDGIQPQTLEGKIVSDADMCDAVGAVSVIRACEYGKQHGRPFFLHDSAPDEQLTRETYTNYKGTSTINHFFEKILLLQDLMLTKSGKAEAKARHEFTVDFLRNYFMEINEPKWLSYLDKFLAQHTLHPE